MINESLRDYLENTILPRYATYDKGHNIDHIQEVASGSLELAQSYEVDINMVYTIALFHDLGLIHGRENHHRDSALLLRADSFIQAFFTEEEITLMAEAVEDHRASNKSKPRSIYGEIVSSADRIIDADTIIRRSIYYHRSHNPALTDEERLGEVYRHMVEKYGEEGYLQVPILTERNRLGLEQLRMLLREECSFLAYAHQLINQL